MRNGRVSVTVGSYDPEFRAGGKEYPQITFVTVNQAQEQLEMQYIVHNVSEQILN
jgi:hypothetical protein